MNDKDYRKIRICSRELIESVEVITSLDTNSLYFSFGITEDVKCFEVPHELQSEIKEMLNSWYSERYKDCIEKLKEITL